MPAVVAAPAIATVIVAAAAAAAVGVAVAVVVQEELIKRFEKVFAKWWAGAWPGL